MLHITDYTPYLKGFQKIINKVRGIYLVPQSIFILSNADVKTSMQIDFNDGNSCQIAAYTDPYGTFGLKINHTCLNPVSDHLCEHIIYSTLIYEIACNPGGQFSNEFLDTYDIPVNNTGINEIITRFKKPIEKYLPLATIDNMTICPKDEQKEDVTLDVLFLRSSPALVPAKKKPKHLPTQSTDDIDLEELLLKHLKQE